MALKVIDRTPVKAIRAFCLDCSGTSNMVRDCPSSTCPLFKYRFGKNPNFKSKNDEDGSKVQSDQKAKDRNLGEKEGSNHG